MKRKTLAAAAFPIFIVMLIQSCSASGGLTCSISDSCPGTPVVYMKNSTGGYMNAHAQNASLGTYAYSVCCMPASGSLGYGCGQATVLRLSNETNAHVQAGNFSGPGDIYTVNACLSSDSGAVQCLWGNSCGSDYECLASMAGANVSLGNFTNAMLGPCGQYQVQVCCRIYSSSNIWFSPPTPDNQSSTNQDWIPVNVSSGDDLDSCLLDWYNGTWQNMSMSVSGRNCYLNVSGLAEGDYFYRVWANSAGGQNVTGTRKVMTDFTKPDLWFSAVTLSNQSTTANNWITVDVLANETLSSCILEWHSTAWINVSMVVDGNYCYKTMIGLSQGYYYFRVYGNDSAGNMNVTEDRQIRYYVAPSQPQGGDTGGSSGGGGSPNITSISAVKLTRSFSIEPDFLKVLLKQGETRNSSFRIKNTGNVELPMISEMTAEGDYFILDLPRNFTLALNETRTVNLYMLSFEDTEPGVHTGTVFIRSGDMTKMVSAVMEVSEKQGLFDASLDIPKESLFISPGSSLPLHINLTNLGENERVNVTAIYVIKDMYGKQIISQKETFAVETHLSLIKSIQIPEGIEPGRYSAFIVVEYEDQAAVASSEFEVAEKVRPIETGTDIFIWSIIGGSVAAVIALSFVLIRRSKPESEAAQYIKNEEEFHGAVLVEKKKPAPGPGQEKESARKKSEQEAGA